MNKKEKKVADVKEDELDLKEKLEMFEGKMGEMMFGINNVFILTQVIKDILIEKEVITEQEFNKRVSDKILLVFGNYNSVN